VAVVGVLIEAVRTSRHKYINYGELQYINYGELQGMDELYDLVAVGTEPAQSCCRAL
jgi:hypothetical protein